MVLIWLMSNNKQERESILADDVPGREGVGTKA